MCVYITFWLQWLSVEVYLYLWALCHWKLSGLISLVQNKRIWQQIERCFVFWGRNVITDEKLKQKKGNMELGPWQREPTASGLSSATSLDHLLSESTKAAGVKEHWTALQRPSSNMKSVNAKQSTTRASHSLRAAQQIFVNIGSPVLFRETAKHKEQLDNTTDQK